MRFINYLVFIALFGLVVFSSCKDESTFEDPEVDSTLAYFPLAIGQSITYRLDSIIYDPINETQIEIDTNIVYIREDVVDTFTNEVGELVYRIERFESQNTNFDWQIRDVWSATKSNTRAERFEENLRFIKLVFPVEDGEVWNGNLYIDETTLYPVAGESVEIFKSWFYEIMSTDVPEVIGGYSFDEVTTVQQANEENLIERRYSLEKYAKGVGLVYREMEIYDTQEIDESIPWEEKADKGFKLTMTVVDY